MNLTALYQWNQEYETGIHVTVSSPFDIYDEHGKLLKHVEPGLNGKVVKLDIKNKTFTAYFEDDSFHVDLDPTHFTIRRDLDAKKAYSALQKFFGHYSRTDEQLYQFNIKMHGYQIPDKAYELLGQDKVWDILYEMQEDLFRNFVGEDYDYAPLSFFDWVKLYFADGKNGGYLMIQDTYPTKEAYNQVEYFYLEAISEYSDDTDYVTESLNELLTHQKDLIERVYDLLMIEKLISVYQNDHYQEVNRLSFWMEQMKYEQA